MSTVLDRARGGPDLRGNNQDRAARKRWMLATFGDGATVPCRWCSVTLTYETVEADRHPIAGKDGGRYTRDNVVPACRRCNAGRDGREDCGG